MGRSETPNLPEEPNKCTIFLQDTVEKGRVSSRMRDFISFEKRAHDRKKDLFTIFVDNNIEFRQAKSCPSLFDMFLKLSGNHLLLRLLASSKHTGRSSGGMNLDSFKTIW